MPSQSTRLSFYAGAASLLLLLASLVISAQSTPSGPGTDPAAAAVQATPTPAAKKGGKAGKKTGKKGAKAAKTKAQAAQNPAGPAAPTPPAGAKTKKKAAAGTVKKPALDLDNILEQLRVPLGATEIEWTALRPLLADVIRARLAQLQARDTKILGKTTKTPAPDPAADPAGAVSPLDRASEERSLQDALASAEASVADLKSRMAAYRASLRKIDYDLKSARDRLRQVLTIKQEATLLLLDYMD